MRCFPGKKMLAAIGAAAIGSAALAQQADYPIQPVPFTAVELSDHFWEPKLRINAEVTIPYTLEKCRENGRIDNFLRAAKKLNDDHYTVYPFDDTDLYKVIEGASYGLQVKKNPQLELYLDSLIRIIGDAQEPDGYLYTFRTMHASKPHEWIGSKRWEKEEDLSHELYNCGHLYEAAVAHYQATGKKTLLHIALKNADLLVKDIGYGKIEVYPGHQIVETGLVKLYRVTGEKKYLDLAKFFLDVRGPKGAAYSQSNKKVTEQHEAEGHAVRAAYMYSGMADVAALTGDQRYLMAIDDIWKDVVDKKIYITGGIGATGNGEAFGDAFDLPNMSAYAETCASIANVYWNNRMFLLHGDAQYIDVLEKTLYNGLLAGVSLSGDHFFYPNPLASMGQHQRSAWFSCACCISNMARFLPSMPGYIYAHNKNDLYVNLFVSNTAQVPLEKGMVTIRQQTEYPWEGGIGIEIDPANNTGFTLRVRIPGWAKEQPLPGGLYHYADHRQQLIPVTVNGETVHYEEEKGYLLIHRNWKKGDQVQVTLPMNARRVLAKDEVKADHNRFALERGPLLYCLEGADYQDSSVQSIVVDSTAEVIAMYQPALLNGVTVLHTRGTASTRMENSSQLLQKPVEVTAIPYYAWCNRGPGEMEVWIPYTPSAAKPKPASTIAARSIVSASVPGKKMLKALNDQYEPTDSKDQSGLYLHWWPKKNTKEWVQYNFDKAYTISQSTVYWFDDGPWGGCRVPLSWKLYYQQNGNWMPVKNTSPYTTGKDRYNTVRFAPVTTTALKLELQLPKDNAAGIHEWMVK